jgi:hypothetical protein
MERNLEEVFCYHAPEGSFFGTSLSAIHAPHAHKRGEEEENLFRTKLLLFLSLSSSRFIHSHFCSLPTQDFTTLSLHSYQFMQQVQHHSWLSLVRSLAVVCHKLYTRDFYAISIRAAG